MSCHELWIWGECVLWVFIRFRVYVLLHGVVFPTQTGVSGLWWLFARFVGCVVAVCLGVWVQLLCLCGAVLTSLGLLCLLCVSTMWCG